MLQKSYRIRSSIILKLYSIKKTGKSIKSGAMKIEKILSRELGNRLSFLKQEDIKRVSNTLVTKVPENLLKS